MLLLASVQGEADCLFRESEILDNIFNGSDVAFRFKRSSS